MNKSFYDLGRAIAIFDPHGEAITPTAIQNMLANPPAAPVYLRHVWREMLEDGLCGPILRRIDLPSLTASEPHKADFWLGFWHQRGQMMGVTNAT